jgi:hypothetical protein
MKSGFRALLMGCVAFACSGETAFEGEVGGSQKQAFGIAQCASAGVVKTSATRFDYSSLGGYGTACNANEVTSMDSANVGNIVAISAPLPANETECLATFILADLYQWGGAWSHVTEIENRGAWWPGFPAGAAGSVGGSSGGSAKCLVQPVNFGRLTPGGRYRIAATARTYHGTTSFTALPFNLSTL